MRIVESPYRADDRCGWCGVRRGDNHTNPSRGWVLETEADHRTRVDQALAAHAARSEDRPGDSS